MSKVAKAIVGIAAIGAVAFTGGAALFAGAVTWSSVGTFLTNTIAGRLLSSVALSALSQALMKPGEPKRPGIRSSNTAQGDVNPDSFILGRYATAGSAVCPPYTHTRSGHKTPNPYLQYVIDLGGAPGHKLVGMTIDGRTCKIRDFIWTDDKSQEYGYQIEIEGSADIWAWVRYYDGTQPAADPKLLARYGNHPSRPWTADMVGNGICYAIVTFQLNEKLFSGFPQVQFIMDGIPLYDPRKDSTAGGNGAQRWGQPATYAMTENPAVQVYNLLRGVELPGGRVYGGRARADQLPTSSWFAGMNACDAAVALEGGGSEAAWRTSYEVLVSDEPAAVIEELCSAASIQLTEAGGTWKIRVGAPSVPVAWLTDDDIMISHEQRQEQFPGLDQTYNGASISSPDPASGWQATEGSIYLRSDYVAQDQGRELIADLSLPAAPYPLQNQRLARAYVEEERRFRRHVVTLPPDYGYLEPLDVLAWSSVQNGYEDKLFEVVQTNTDPVTQLVTVSLRERDPADYDWQPSFQLPYAPQAPIWSGPVAVEVGDFAVSALVITDTAGKPRRPALALTWNTEDMEGIDGLEWQLRLSSSSEVQLRGSTSDVGAGRLVIAEGILAATSYLVQARMVGKAFDVIWSEWIQVTSPDVRLGSDDLSEDLKDELAGRDAEPPAKPTGLALSSTASGETVKLFADWTANAEEDLLGYVVGIKEGDGLFITFQTRERHHEWTVAAGQAYTVRVQALDTSNNASPWSDEVTLTAARDTVPPPVPTGVSAAPGIGSILLKWTAVAADDLARYEVYESGSTTAPVAATAASYSATANLTSVTGYTGEVTRYFWIRAVDTSGNKSAWSARVSAKTISGETVITTEKLKGLVDQTSMAQGLLVPEVVFALPSAPHICGRQVTLMTDGKIYRNTGSGWTRAVDGADLIANSIVAAAIAAGAVGADQMAANSVGAKQLLVADFQNAILDPDYAPDNAGAWGWLGDTAGLGRAVPPSPMVRPWSLTIADTITQGTGVRVPPSTPIPCKPKEQWLVSAAVRPSGNTPRLATMALIAYYYTAPGVGAGLPAEASPDIACTNVARIEISHAFTIPEGVSYVSFGYVRRSAPQQYGMVYVSEMSARRMNAGELTVDGSIRGRHIAIDQAVITVSAQIANAIINDAHIENLSAAILRAGTALAGSLTVSGEALTSIRGKAAQGAQDPAIRINQGATTINPGLIEISGGTRLTNWISGGDTTKIRGGAMELNSLKAEHMQIGLRNITLTGILFEHDSPADNRASWTAGAIRWTNDAGATVSTSIAAGSTGTWSSGVFYIYWAKGEGILRATSSISTAFGDNNVILATYEGAERLDADYGRTMIDGLGIKTGSLDAGDIGFGTMNGRYLEITERLEMLGTAAFSWGKDGIGDISDGIFFGKAQDGSQGFGFAVSRTAGNKRQSVELSSDGFKISNARHVITSFETPIVASFTTNVSRRAFPASARKVSFKGVGGGAGGVAGNSANAGAPTTIRLYDGSTLKTTITMPGGGINRLNRLTSRGHSHGFGGASYYTGNVPAGGNASGPGGGGGGGITGPTGQSYYGGFGAPLTTSSEINISGWADPRYEITMGVGGAAASSGGYTSGAGGRGHVEMTYTGAIEVPADVVPLIPTASGSFTKQGGTGPFSFPDLGAGFWIVDRGGNDIVALGRITVAPGITIWASGTQTVSFFSSHTPTYSSEGGTVTLFYKFYSMGGWG